jgi:hypothetical protein
MANKRTLRRSMFLAALAACSLTAATAAAQGAPEKDGVRFRGGIALAGGGLFVSGFSAGMGGLDGRLGVQINNLIGIYAQPHLSFGGGKTAWGTGFLGTAGSSALVDFTLFDHLTAGVGGGGALLQNVGAGELHFRLAGYPVVGRGENGIRRKGFMLGLDTRLYFITGGQVLQMMGAIGYEAF